MTAPIIGYRRLTFDRAPWQSRAACRGIDPALFFPGRGEDQATPKAVCARCPVRVECLEYALANRETDGIWGGTSGRERRRIRTARRRAARKEAAA